MEVDTSSFGAALRAALRQDPDVILVGEMRDLETIQTALLAAETGHMVFSTLHTMDATETIQRIIAVFRRPNRSRFACSLASTLKAIISQRLVRRADGIGRVPAVEVLVATEYIRDCIINPDKTRLIHDAISAGVSQYGMQTFDQSLYDHYTQGLMTLDEALEQFHQSRRVQTAHRGNQQYRRRRSRRDGEGVPDGPVCETISSPFLRAAAAPAEEKANPLQRARCRPTP